ncbi:Crp/Fnr family transcriptional regulator [Phyllobacterium lublinensis]|uniref:Crp/Fnr family transcriptional regulator n=1 Tax=Phyllobacterium lublinensis TaxID=2875708 RepID=UPI001CCD31C6|nr:helix-turn-helix domain-containing protein [Phyllobacterium sp. 2063]MBZ9653574.1 helix-turn-helix domain-containing protein [Phyllobacterium sp. 2063]
MRDFLLLYVQTLMVQTTSTAIANSKYLVDARLARWLLMVDDLTRGNDLIITHELLSIMLGARRPYITAALRDLKNNNLIRSKRGQLTIIDRNGLIHLANGSYGMAEKEYDRLFHQVIG